MSYADAGALTEIEQAAEELAGGVAEGRPNRRALWQIEGPPTAGKSSCLSLVAALLDERSDLEPVLVAPPAHHLDAGAVSLADVAVGLGSRGLLNGELSGWSEGVGRWGERLEAVKEWTTSPRSPGRSSPTSASKGSAATRCASLRGTPYIGDTNLR